MAKVTPITQRYQQFLTELRETFWGDLYRQTREACKRLLEAQSERERLCYLGFTPYQRQSAAKMDARNGYYERDFVTRLGTLRLRIAQTQNKSFLPSGTARFSRRAEEVPSESR